MMKPKWNLFFIVMTVLAVFFWSMGQPCLAEDETAGAEQPLGDNTAEASEDVPADDFQDDLGGDFQDDPESIPDIAMPNPVGHKKKSIYKINGHLKLGTAYNYAQDAPQPGQTDWREFSSLKSEVMLELDLKLSESWKAFVIR